MSAPAAAGDLGTKLAELVDEVQANGWTVEFVEWCEDAETPGFLGQIGGVCVHQRKAIKVKTHNVSEEALVAVLAHEIEHMRGREHATDHPELGLWCGGRTNVWGRGRGFGQESDG